ncbi:MAG: sigma-70 family RNA polymerase sigma factor [Oscillospiraceae bacterium]|nr:sigma-70 family RNA polymerase sigma factor [Oscillospiraceae bacterium]
MVSDRDRKITENIGLVHSVANKFRGRGADYDDLFQAGCVGLIKAVDNFDETKGFAFSTYAVPVIMGEIKRIFRDGGLIKVSRSLKEKSQKIQIARDEFQHKYMREPTVSELAELSGVPAEEIPEALGVLAPTLSLSGSSDDDEESDIPIDDSDRLFDRLAIIGAVSNLSYEEKMLVQYRFFDGKTQSDTAELLGVSQVQVSRKEKNILLKMRQNLQE